jgi:hypothetical protein
MPPFLAAKTLGLPRWAWAGMLVGGVGLGLYLRHKNSASEPEEETSEEGPKNSGSLVPPAAPIESGGGVGVSEGTIPLYPKVEPIVPNPSVAKPEAEEPELPESKPPPEAVTPGPNHPAEPVHNSPITTPANKPAIGENKAVAPPADTQEREKARNEINRLQDEINGLQNHISQLTSALQEHPNAKQHGQWESERNSDRSNIENKRSQVTWWSAQ